MKPEDEESVGDVSRAACTEAPRGTRSWGPRLLTLAILWAVFWIVSVVISPPDVITQITLAVEMLIVCGVVIFAVSRFKSYKQTPENMRRVIVALVCLLSIATVYSSMLHSYCRRLNMKLYEQTTTQDHLE